METFLVRVWVPGKDEPARVEPGAFRGLVEHVRSGRLQSFVGVEELVERFGDAIGALREPLPAGPARIPEAPTGGLSDRGGGG